MTPPESTPSAEAPWLGGAPTAPPERLAWLERELAAAHGQLAEARSESAELTRQNQVLRDMAASPGRLTRQERTAAWISRTFGANLMAPSERVARFVEEALELAQACDLPRGDIDSIANHIYAKPTGEAAQEFGGVGVTLLGLATSLGLDADALELQELVRVEAIPPEYFRARHNRKADAGIAVRTSGECQ